MQWIWNIYAKCIKCFYSILLKYWVQMISVARSVTKSICSLTGFPRNSNWIWIYFVWITLMIYYDVSIFNLSIFCRFITVICDKRLWHDHFFAVSLDTLQDQQVIFLFLYFITKIYFHKNSTNLSKNL